MALEGGGFEIELPVRRGGGPLSKDSDDPSSCEGTATYKTPNQLSSRAPGPLQIHISGGGSIPATPELGPQLDGAPLVDEFPLAAFAPSIPSASAMAPQLASITVFPSVASNDGVYAPPGESPNQSRTALFPNLLSASAPQANLSRRSSHLSGMGPDPLGQSQASLSNVSQGSGVYLSKDIQFRQLWRSLVTSVTGGIQEYLRPLSPFSPLQGAPPSFPNGKQPTSTNPTITTHSSQQQHQSGVGTLASPASPRQATNFLGKGISGRVTAMRMIQVPYVPGTPHTQGSESFDYRGQGSSQQKPIPDQLAFVHSATVAVKTIRGIDPRRVSECETLSRELKVLAATRALPSPHPSILTARHVLYDTNNGNVHFILDSKRGNLSTPKPFPEPLAAAVAYAALDALAFLHDVMGFAHRDIKPDNILFDRSDCCEDAEIGNNNDDVNLSSRLPPRGCGVNRGDIDNNHNITTRSDIYLADWGLAEPTRFVSFAHRRTAGSTPQQSLHQSQSWEESPTVPCASGAGENATSSSIGYDVTTTAVGRSLDGASSLPQAMVTQGPLPQSQRACLSEPLVQSSPGQPILHHQPHSTSQHPSTNNPSSSHTNSAVEQALIDDFAGTTLYMAPERLQGLPHGAPSDVWSLGVTIARLVLGQHPFQAALGDAFHSPMPEAKFWGLLEIFCPTTSSPGEDAATSVTIDSVLDGLAVSEGLKDFLRQCLHVSVDQRPCAVELLEHPWLEARLGNTTHLADFIENSSYW